jgi:hypothetical protein
MKNRPDTTLCRIYKKEISVLLRFLLGETVTGNSENDSQRPITLHEIAEIYSPSVHPGNEQNARTAHMLES